MLAAIDDYHNQFNMLMNIGPVKGAHIVNLIGQQKPSTMIELGSYVGYSAILFGEALSQNGGEQYLGIEKNPEMAAVANQLINLAGLQEVARVLVGSSEDVLKQLVKEKVIQEIEFIFIDHWQERYLPDLWLMEELDVLKPGKSVLIADNIIFPGAPKYRKWVESTPEEKNAVVKAGEAGTLNPNPDLIYENTTTEFQTDFGLVRYYNPFNFVLCLYDSNQIRMLLPSLGSLAEDWKIPVDCIDIRGALCEYHHREPCVLKILIFG